MMVVSRAFGQIFVRPVPLRRGAAIRDTHAEPSRGQKSGDDIDRV